MSERRARTRGSRSTPPEASAPEPPSLPTGKAFVLQLSRETGPALEPFAGRVEHLVSGRRLRFESLPAFLDAVLRLLVQAKQS